MLYISKWKATAILLTALICCLFAVPNFFPESMVKRWPAWAQRHIVLGLDLQGGSHILMEVDANDVRRQKLLTLQDDVRRVLRQSPPVGLARAPVIRGNSVEVAIRESDLQQGLTRLRELAQPLGGFIGSTGARSVDIENVGGGWSGSPPPSPRCSSASGRSSINRSRSSVSASINSVSSSRRSSVRATTASSCRCRVSAIPSSCSKFSARPRS
jgi:preprotein translocase subunit SecD